MQIQKVLLVSALSTLVVVSAILVVETTHSTRNAFAKLQVLKKKHREELVVQTQYVLEKSTLLSPTVLEKKAVEKFKMQVPSASQIHVIETTL